MYKTRVCSTTGSDKILRGLWWSLLFWVSGFSSEETKYKLWHAHWSRTSPGSVSEVKWFPIFWAQNYIKMGWLQYINTPFLHRWMSNVHCFPMDVCFSIRNKRQATVSIGKVWMRFLRCHLLIGQVINFTLHQISSCVKTWYMCV